MTSSSYDTFEAVQNRLDEIVKAVSDESVPLDEALALYEEAVSLGLRGSDLLEENIEAFDARCDDAETGSNAAASAVDADEAEVPQTPADESR